MNLLAIDTSSLVCSVALQSGDMVIERHEEQAREHTRLLMPMIRDVLAESGMDLPQLDAIVLGNGPGSFIGMRIAASVAQGLAHGAGLLVVPVSSLAAIAAEVLEDSKVAEVVVAQDAHMSEVYLGAFLRGPENMPVPLFPERLHAQTAIEELASETADSRVAAGFGWQRYPGLLAANEGLIGQSSTVLHPRARCLIPLGAAAWEAGAAIKSADLVPAYLRNKVAEKPSTGKA